MILENNELAVFNQIKSCFKSGEEVSISIIQKRFALGYNAAWRVMDNLLSENFVIKNEYKIGYSNVI